MIGCNQALYALHQPQLLLDTQMQVQHVADALLFSSAANFATAFRRWTGVTPSEYRREAR